MKPKLLLRIASIFMVFHTMGHTLGALTWKTAPNSAVAEVIKGMQSTYFDFMGRSVTLAAFYDGYGFIMILVLLLISTLLWMLSVENGSRLSAWVIQLLGVFLVLMAIIEYLYFFALPAVLSLLAGICTLTALFTSRDKKIKSTA